MTELREEHRCVNCERSENVVPLVVLRYQGAENWICSQCLPTLIHQPARLAGKLADADKIPPAQHD